VQACPHHPLLSRDQRCECPLHPQLYREWALVTGRWRPKFTLVPRVTNAELEECERAVICGSFVEAQALNQMLNSTCI
jgi:hypothetical protein